MSIADDIVTEIFRHNKELPAILAKTIKHKLGVSIGELQRKSGYSRKYTIQNPVRRARSEPADIPTDNKYSRSALVCAPIVSPTVEKIVNLPVTTIKPRASVSRAIEQAAKKIS